MSLTQNTTWIEESYQNFQEALELGDWQTCELVIRDTKYQGFTQEAEKMRKELEHDRFHDQ